MSILRGFFQLKGGFQSTLLIVTHIFFIDLFILKVEFKGLYVRAAIFPNGLIGTYLMSIYKTKIRKAKSNVKVVERRV